ncbi:unnamed protein product, partial [Schistocephalus solidus]|uniref:Reverse transcriptase domain-containing protein n=1 Tax=Schistocephalus solidus TaxID=70667 RepID=A0A183TRJ5_SCHSO
WRQGQVPQDFKDATIVHLYKRKRKRQLCGNHRGITLLNIAGKIFARILLNHLNGHLEPGLLPESQCGFRRQCRTTDMIFAARQLQEKCQEMRTHLYTTFVDLTKAFDTVNRDGLWKVMRKFGCPERFTHMVRQLHDGMTARVTDNGTVSEALACCAVRAEQWRGPLDTRAIDGLDGFEEVFHFIAVHIPLHLISLSDHPCILQLTQPLPYMAPAAEKGCFGGVSPKVHVDFV